MSSPRNANSITTEIILKRNYVNQETLQDCLLEMEVAGQSLLDILKSKGFLEEPNYQELKWAMKLSQSQSRQAQEEILLSKLFLESGMIDQGTLEKAFLKKEKSSENLSLSQILLDMRVVDPKQVEHAEHLLQGLDMRCEKCGRRFKVQNIEKNKPLQCPNCVFILLPETKSADVSTVNTIVSTSQQPPVGKDTVLEGKPTGGETVAEGVSSDTGDSIKRGKDETTTRDPILGQKIGECRIIKKLGQGGMGAVYLGENLKLARREAVKVLPSEFASNPEQLIRFQREAKAAGTLDSPHIVRVLNIGEDKGINYICMEFVEGTNLQKVIEEKEKVPLKEALGYIKQAAQGLIVAHNKEIMHRDIKPDNLMLSKDGTVKVADFGLARKVKDTMGVTQEGSIMGTPYFMSPEQCGGDPTDQRSDIYSLGATFYYMIAGQHPFSGETPMAILLKHMHQDATPPHVINSEIPPSISNVIEKMMEKKAEFRYQKLEEFLEDIKKIEEGEEVGISEGKKKRIFRRRLKRVLVLSLLLGVALFFYYFQPLGKTEVEMKKEAFLVSLQQGKELESKGDWENAAGHFKSALDRDKNSPEAITGLYKSLLQLAEQQYKKARGMEMEKYSNLFESLKNSVSYLQEARKLKTEGEEVLPLLAKAGELYVETGQYLFEKKNFSDCRKALDGLKEAYDGLKISVYPPAYTLLEKKLQRAEIQEKIHATLERALSLFDPALKELGEKEIPVLQKKLREALDDKIEKAKKDVQDAQSLDRTHKEANQFAALIRLEMEERKKEELLLQKANQAWKDLSQKKKNLVNSWENNFNGNVEKFSLQVADSILSAIEITLPEFEYKFSRKKEDFAHKSHSSIEDILENFQNEKKDLEEKLKIYKKQRVFLGRYEEFTKLKPETDYSKMESLHQNGLEGLEKDLCQLAAKTLSNPEGCQKNIQVRIEKAREFLFREKFKKATEMIVALNKNKDSTLVAQKKKEIIQFLLDALKKMPDHDQTQELLAEFRTGENFVYIPKGKYKIGSLDSFMDNPEKDVELSKSFYLSKYEITNGEYLEFVKEGGYNFTRHKKYWDPEGEKYFFSTPGKKALYKPCPSSWEKYMDPKTQKLLMDRLEKDESWKKLPVCGVTFYEAQAYTRWLSEKVSVREKRNIQIRLPMEKEWEIAASYDFSNRERPNRYIYPLMGGYKEEYNKYFERESPLPVGEWKEDRSFSGCFDMAGNVSEWISLSETKGVGLRGASFDSTKPEIQAKCSFGGFKPRPESRMEDVGFRICMDTDPWKKP